MFNMKYERGTRENTDQVEEDTIVANMYSIGKPYAITINPDDLHQYNEYDLRFSRFMDFWNKFIQKLPFIYEMYIEISNPDCSMKCPRIHMHGIITFNTYQQLNMFYSKYYYELSKKSMFLIKPIDNIIKWSKYCIKNHEIMKGIFSHEKLEPMISSFNFPKEYNIMDNSKREETVPQVASRTESDVISVVPLKGGTFHKTYKKGKK